MNAQISVQGLAIESYLARDGERPFAACGCELESVELYCLLLPPEAQRLDEHSLAVDGRLARNLRCHAVAAAAERRGETFKRAARHEALAWVKLRHAKFEAPGKCVLLRERGIQSRVER